VEKLGDSFFGDLAFVGVVDNARKYSTGCPSAKIQLCRAKTSFPHLNSPYYYSYY